MEQEHTSKEQHNVGKMVSQQETHNKQHYTLLQKIFKTKLLQK
jgi:hypothetical protein